RRTSSPKPSEQTEALHTLSRSVAGLRTQLLAGQIGLNERAAIQKGIDEHETALDEARSDLEKLRRPDRIAWVGTLSPKQVQELLNPDEDLIEVLLGEHRSFAWLASRNRLLKIEVLPGRGEIEKAVERYIRVINARPKSPYSEKQQDEVKKASENVLTM